MVSQSRIWGAKEALSGLEGQLEVVGLELIFAFSTEMQWLYFPFRELALNLRWNVGSTLSTTEVRAPCYMIDLRPNFFAEYLLTIGLQQVIIIYLLEMVIDNSWQYEHAVEQDKRHRVLWQLP